MNYKKSIILAAGFGVVLCGVLLARAQGVSVAQRYEVATIKWDGSDKLQFITPQKSEVIRLFKTGVQLPQEIHDQEFCMTLRSFLVGPEH